METNFVNACILQFPYERGGFDELRKKPDVSFITSSIADIQHPMLNSAAETEFCIA